VFKIEPTAESEENLRRAFQRMESAIVGVAKVAPALGWNAYSEVVDEIFDSEGSFIGEPWTPLAERTQSERESLGYEPAHPMLQREGHLLRSLTDLSMGSQIVPVYHEDRTEMVQSGNIHGISALGADVKLQVGTLDERFLILYHGGAFRNIEQLWTEGLTGDSGGGGPIPPRHMVPGEAHRDLVGERIDSFLVEEIDEHLNG
jgi:hypothetical protein